MPQYSLRFLSRDSHGAVREPFAQSNGGSARAPLHYCRGSESAEGNKAANQHTGRHSPAKGPTDLTFHPSIENEVDLAWTIAACVNDSQAESIAGYLRGPAVRECEPAFVICSLYRKYLSGVDDRIDAGFTRRNPRHC